MKKTSLWKVLSVLVPKIARVSPGLFVLWQGCSFAHGVSYGVIVPVTQIFFDRAAAFAVRETALPAVVGGLLLLALAHIVKQALNGTANFMNRMYYRKAEGALSASVHQKISRLAPVCFEDTKTLDDINKAVQGKNEAVWFTGTILIFFSFYLPYFLCMAVYLVQIKPLLLVSLALVFIPTLLSQIFRMKFFSKAEDQSAPVRRKFEYYESCMAGREYFKETRILGAFPYFQKRYTEALALLNRLRFRASVKSDMAELGMQLLSLSGYIGILLLLLDSLLKGDISAGAFAAVFSSIGQMFSLMKEMICYNFGAAARDYGRVQNYLRFLDMPERGGMDMRLPKDVDLSMRKVSFAYPGADGKKAVKDVSLTIHNGETIAVVGENGSGKTTLIRLLLGLYTPDEGDIFYGTVNTKTASGQALFQNSSAVFQKYQRYQMTLGENIGISDTTKTADTPLLDNACIQAGLDTNAACFSNGYATMLSREFDGVDLSGGQWQRAAIARGFFRSSQLIVLDEPTAAIDPLEETKIYERFAEISKGKTAVIVTHRLGSVKLADRIFVMKQGSLAEQGAQEELMAAGGEYARLYKLQEKWYHS